MFCHKCLILLCNMLCFFLISDAAVSLNSKAFLSCEDLSSTAGVQEEKTKQEVLKVAIFIILKLCTGNQRHQSANWYKGQVFLQLAC